MAKDQFQSGESLQVRFAAFYDKTTGEPILGTDTATYVARRPDGTTIASTPLSFDSLVNLWTADVATGSFQAGEWRFKATSSNTNALPQTRILHWGGYVDDLTTTRVRGETLAQLDLGAVKQGVPQTFVVTLQGTLGAPITAAVATNVTLELMKAGVATSRVLTAPEFAHVASGRYRVTLPAGDFGTVGTLRATLTDVVSTASAVVVAAVAAVTSDDLSSTLISMNAALTLVRQIQQNRWRVDSALRRLIIYADDGSTQIGRAHV